MVSQPSAPVGHDPSGLEPQASRWAAGLSPDPRSSFKIHNTFAMFDIHVKVISNVTWVKNFNINCTNIFLCRI